MLLQRQLRTCRLGSRSASVPAPLCTRLGHGAGRMHERTATSVLARPYTTVCRVASMELQEVAIQSNDAAKLAALAAQTAIPPESHPDNLRPDVPSGEEVASSTAGPVVSDQASNERPRKLLVTKRMRQANASVPLSADSGPTVISPNFRVGDTVTGRVLSANDRGARIQILQQEGVVG